MWLSSQLTQKVILRIGLNKSERLWNLIKTVETTQRVFFEKKVTNLDDITFRKRILAISRWLLIAAIWRVVNPSLLITFKEFPVVAKILSTALQINDKINLCYCPDRTLIFWSFLFFFVFYLVCTYCMPLKVTLWTYDFFTWPRGK